MDAESLARFEAKCRHDPDTGCWLWSGTVSKAGYGRMTIHRKDFLAHRLSYEHHVGPIPAGLQIDHYRLNPGTRNAPCSKTCVNPAHLEPVTRVENVMRGESGHARNARKTHCLRLAALKTPYVEGARMTGKGRK